MGPIFNATRCLVVAAWSRAGAHYYHDFMDLAAEDACSWHA